MTNYIFCDSNLSLERLSVGCSSPTCPEQLIGICQRLRQSIDRFSISIANYYGSNVVNIGPTVFEYKLVGQFIIPVHGSHIYLHNFQSLLIS